MEIFGNSFFKKIYGIMLVSGTRRTYDQIPEEEFDNDWKRNALVLSKCYQTLKIIKNKVLIHYF
jgi:hypothetical protein